MSIVAIVNPVSGRGGASQAWERVRAHLKDGVKALQTKAPGHGIELTTQAIKDGAGIVIAVGGDGTINEVVNGFFEHGKLISDGAVLGILPHGTGSDFQRILHLPGGAATAADRIQSGNFRAIDLLNVRYTKSDGDWASRFSINLTSFGMGGLVASRVSRASKAFGGKASFVLATVRTAADFRGNSVTIRLDDTQTIEANVTNVAVGNGQYHGGGMQACPRAAIDDGFLDVTLIEFMRLPELVRNLRLLYNGKIYSHSKVKFFRVMSIRADSKQTALIEIDGEPLGRLPVEISIVPRAIRLLS